MRVLLWDLPVWMKDIIEHAVAAEPRLALVQAPEGTRVLRDALAQIQPDVLVTGGGDRDVPFSGFAPLLFEFPFLRVFSIGGSAADTVQVTLIPTQVSLGDVSLDALLSLIAGESHGVSVQPTRHVSSE